MTDAATTPSLGRAHYERPIIEAIDHRDIEGAEEAVVSCFTQAHAEISALSPEAFETITRSATKVIPR